MTQGRSQFIKQAIWSGAALLLAFVVIAYFVLPLFWKHYEHEPALADVSMRTETAQNIAGDPLNIGLVGNDAEVLSAFQQIGWTLAEAVTLESSLEIGSSVILNRPYAAAPVSALFYQGRKQDLAFERLAGASADQRHHVRLWQVIAKGSAGKPVWLGAASFDKGVGLSHYTGQITHHIDADIDAERDGLIKAISEAGLAESIYQVSGIGPALTGRNGGDDPFQTDGELTVAVLREGAVAVDEAPNVLENPPLVRLKQTIWSAFAGNRP